MTPLAGLFSQQADACARLGSPFMQRLLTLCGQRLAPGQPIADRLLDWPGDATALGDAIALRFAGALHALVLMGRDEGLRAAYPPNEVTDDQLWSAIAEAMQTHHDHIMHWLDSAPQTNEVRRATAMIAASQLLATRFPALPFRVFELGASAGLNLFFDRYDLALPDGTTRGAEDPVITLSPEWTGPLPPRADVRIAERRGVDLNPLRPDDPQARLRLTSYTWPDQPERMARLQAALGIATPVVDQGDAGTWLAERLATPSPGHITLVFHTIAWQYFPPATDAACRAALEAAGARATPDAPLAHLWVEANRPKHPATVQLHLWPGDGSKQSLDLGEMNPHGITFAAWEPFAL
ncbi:DUF2332 domain-containing protein [Pseudooceanicola sp.]|uniref:DUF2332 domain-containing protein n=1 Tax=Pseudooceanicola sp. TaxID=1914328 RepID=UPI0035C6FB11